MSFRTVEITGPAELHIKNGSLVIEKEIKETVKTNSTVVPAGDRKKQKSRRLKSW